MNAKKRNCIGQHLTIGETPMQSTAKKNQRKGAQILPSENQVQIATVEYCWFVHKVTAVHVPNELMRFLNDGQKIFQCKMGSRPQFPDLIIFESRGIYHGLIIELKPNKKRQVGAGQINWIEYLNERNYFAKLCIGLDDVLDTVDTYLNLKNNQSMEHA